MVELYELRISGLSEIEAFELQNAIEEETKIPNAIETSSEPLPDAGKAGDPGLIAAAITYGPPLISTLAGALAAWIVAAKKRTDLHSVKFSIGWKGITYSNTELKELEQKGSGDALKSALSHLLRAPEGGEKENAAGE